MPAPAAGARSDAATGPAARARVDARRLPAPGSYRLSRIHGGPDGEVLAQRRPRQRACTACWRPAIGASFMYTYCRDPEGCPRPGRAMEAVHAALLADRGAGRAGATHQPELRPQPRHAAADAPVRRRTQRRCAGALALPDHRVGAGAAAAVATASARTSASRPTRAAADAHAEPPAQALPVDARCRCARSTAWRRSTSAGDRQRPAHAADGARRGRP